MSFYLLNSFAIHQVFTFLLAVNLIGLFTNVVYFSRPKALGYTFLCLDFILFYTWLLWFAPSGFLNFSSLDSGLILISIIIGFELFINSYPNPQSLFKWCILLFLFENFKFNTLDFCLEYLVTHCVWVIYAVVPFFVLGYLWVFKKLFENTLKVSKSKGFFWVFFGLQVHKLKKFFNYISLSRKYKKYSMLFFVEDIVFVPISVVSLIRTFFAPFVGVFLTYNIVFCSNTSLFWLFFSYLCLLTLVVNNPCFQSHVKNNYGPLFFKMGLWNVIGVVCAWCGQVGATGLILGVANTQAVAWQNNYNYKNDVKNWLDDHAAWSSQRLTTSVNAAGPEPVRPQRLAPCYNQVSISERGFNSAVASLKEIWKAKPPKSS